MLNVPILPTRGDYSVLPSTDGKPVSGLIANVDLELIESKFPTAPTAFRIDPGAACSSMSLRRAERLGLLKDDDRIVDLRSRTASDPATIQRVRIGTLIARIAKLRSSPFSWPVVFYPNWPDTTPLLLGLAGVISDLTFHFDGSPNTASVYGSVTVTLRIPANHSS
jgi:hypothetical protein